MENLAPFRQGHSGNPLDVITTSGRFRMDFFDDCGSHLEAQSIMDRQGGEGGNKNKDGGTTQTERLKIWAFLLLSYSQRRHNDHFYAW